MPTDTNELIFKALQTYDNGEVVRWIDPPAESAAAPEHPAPVVKLTPANANQAAVNSTGDAGSSTGTWGVVLGIVGIALGIIGIIVGLVNRRSATAG